MSKSRIIIRHQSCDEEFEYILSLINEREFFQQNGYVVKLPNHEKFQNAFFDKNTPTVNVDELKLVFKNSIYRKNDYEKGTNKLSMAINDMASVWHTFGQWCRDWDFKLFPQYQIALTLYGTGGMYLPDEGRVVMLTNLNGEFQDENPLETIIHEIVHLGIEENIVSLFNLGHWEKERLVDLICTNSFKTIIPHYKMQDLDKTEIDKFVTQSSMRSLPSSIEEYIRSKH